MPFDFFLGDSGATGPDFGVDAADEGDQEKKGSGGGEDFGGVVESGRPADQTHQIKAEPRQEQHQGELHELGVKIAEELPEFHIFYNRFNRNHLEWNPDPDRF